MLFGDHAYRIFQFYIMWAGRRHCVEWLKKGVGQGDWQWKWGALVEWPNSIGKSNNSADAAAATATTTGDVTLAWSAFCAFPRARQPICWSECNAYKQQALVIEQWIHFRHTYQK